MVSDDLLSPMISKRELAELLDVDTYTIDAWRKTNRIPQPVVLSPQIVRWSRKVIAEWLAQRQARPAATRQPNARPPQPQPRPLRQRRQRR